MINNVSVFSENDNLHYDMSRRSLVLDPAHKNIEIEFSSLDFRHPEMVHYSYKMSGIDDDWVSIDDREFAVYSQLKKGHYTFSVRAMNENGLWSPVTTELEIYKRPAFYEAWWAYLVYLLAVALLVRLAYRMVVNRIKLINDLKIAQIEKEKSEELAQAKLRYFTNISHDFLTPLTILSCLADDGEMMQGAETARSETIRSNIDRLRRLLQQVLDFRKVESGNMKLKISEGDIATFIRDICTTGFDPLIRKKRMDFSFDASPACIRGWFDADKMDKIVFNLLSNAFKYTPEGGRVEVRVSKYTREGFSRLAIEVEDSGIGISKENLQNIFTRFVSGKMSEAANSNGVGLNLTKDLIELHRGTIRVENIPGEGSVFTVEVPIDKEFFLPSELDEAGIAASSLPPDRESVQTPAADEDEKVNGMRILVVEDNEELLSLMKRILSRSYRVATAADGLEALRIVRRGGADIVISDVMMPGMDGLEFCRTVKNDIETSHIPVILLTARNSTEDRIECYDAGADGYIAKPFDMKVLDARIRNFISAQRARQQIFRSSENINIGALDYHSKDEILLDKAVGIIEKHLIDSRFDVSMLAAELHLTESTLYRKLKTITGLSPVKFVRNIRLKHACAMLRSHGGSTVAEIAYAVGFSDPNYFAICFKAEFGMTPSDYKKNHHPDDGGSGFSGKK